MYPMFENKGFIAPSNSPDVHNYLQKKGDGKVESIFKGLKPGNRVKVEWKQKIHGHKECYGKEGIIEQITPSFVAIRTRSGYVFCVNTYHIKTGSRIKKVRSA
jgi:hypothetical protein